MATQADKTAKQEDVANAAYRAAKASGATADEAAQVAGEAVAAAKVAVMSKAKGTLPEGYVAKPALARRLLWHFKGVSTP